MFKHPLKIVVSLLYLFTCTGCFRYQLYDEAKKLQARSESLRVQGKFREVCPLVLTAHEKVPSWELSPQSLTFEAICYERGIGVDARDREKAIELFRRSAECGNSEAISELRRLGEPVPKVLCELGDQYLMCLSDTHCGLRSEVTPIGMLLTAPIWVPVGTIMFAGAMLTLPLCVLIAPFIEGRCM